MVCGTAETVPWRESEEGSLRWVARRATIRREDDVQAG